MKKICSKILIIIGIGIFVFIAIQLFVLRYHKQIISTEEFSGREIALVFGGGMSSETVLSDMQEDRVKVAIDLYKAGKIEKMIMTGDNGARRFDEVTYMKKYAVDHGVDEEDVSLDPNGYNTYTSCYRAGKERNLKNIVAISQEFHLSRIIFFCSQFGIDTVGVPANIRTYGFLGRIWVMNIRESLARVKGVLQIYITKPAPLMF
jgi:vancomycin permeability regulator SanA